MERVAVTLDDELAGSLSRYARRHRVNRDVAAERLLASALAEWRLDDAITRFADGQIGFTRAADVATVDPWRFGELLQERALDAIEANDRTATGGDRIDAPTSHVSCATVSISDRP
ncbi:hypothetical protein [Halorubrum sp. DTA98]|uniref:hypothetical protein n=1 Tax=Halorubrum sp. DTA98 TaxID=3402163 RepID=UPI003AAFAE79